MLGGVSCRSQQSWYRLACRYICKHFPQHSDARVHAGDVAIWHEWLTMSKIQTHLPDCILPKTFRPGQQHQVQSFICCPDMTWSQLRIASRCSILACAWESHSDEWLCLPCRCGAWAQEASKASSWPGSISGHTFPGSGSSQPPQA